MKDTFYFSHDYNSRTDSKIKRVIAKHGMLGYGIFWGIIEDLYNNANALPLDYESIAFDLRTDSELIKSVINDFDLFIIDGDCFGSLSVQRRIDERDSKSTKARESANKRWSKVEKNANALQTECESNAIKESKVNKSKEKESKNFKDFFEEIWSLYGKKGNKETSKKKLEKLKQSEIDLMLIHIPIYLASIKERQFVKNFETYLNQRHWETEINGVLVTSETPKAELTEYVYYKCNGWPNEEVTRAEFESIKKGYEGGGYIFTELKSTWK